MVSKARAMIVAVEGKDRLGKTTQVRLLAEALKGLGYRVGSFKLPAYGTFTGRLIRRMLDDGAATRWPNLFQVFQWLDKLAFQAFVLPRAAKQLDVVLLDRWHASMWAYGVATGASRLLTRLLVATLEDPDVTLLMRGAGWAREGDPDAYERDGSIQDAVEREYEARSRASKSVVRPIEATAPIDDVHRAMLAVVLEQLGA